MYESSCEILSESEKLARIKVEILSTDDISVLHLNDVLLTEKINKYHWDIKNAQVPSESFDAKGNLSLANALLDICRDRKHEVRDIGNKLNYNFRMAAKLMLQKTTYEAIWNKAQLPRKEVKEESRNLKNNKIE